MAASIALRDFHFCNSIIDRWVQIRRYAAMSTAIINKVFESIPEWYTSLRLLVVHHIMYTLSSTVFDKILEDLRPDMLKAVARRTVIERKYPQDLRLPENRERCFYHGHDDEYPETGTESESEG
ncbi:uncharacterized protein LTR77_002167 [Saxophila tyrrhenica]|uniref:Uncharacterized protein n=1 Tax=Saxophila tyrrhenica TaxID=1690608 RepID=A0AAV9PMD7_9PEZI|nr:hypothetical protein LTR77_002167 [Saxophila tyrrhenica]